MKREIKEGEIITTRCVSVKMRISEKEGGCEGRSEGGGRGGEGSEVLTVSDLTGN